ncbi:MAG: hypothetical protein J7642_14245 [Cyanobacteria bacterium SBC]|nr:hypothetical protein [Cyanobacteria bacterium SBC]
MDLEMVFNELSLKSPVEDIQSARQLMSELIQTLQQATKSGVQRVLRTEEKLNLNNLELAPGYPISKWRNDREVDREERRFFLTLTTKTSFWIDTAEEIKHNFELSEIWYQGESAGGLGFALVSDALAVSFYSAPKWDCHLLELEVRQLDENEEIVDERKSVVHASRRQHILEHSSWIENYLQSNVRNGLELWDCREELFPNLEFCDSVRQQLASINSGEPMLKHIKKRLSELEKACQNWTLGSFDLDTLPSKATPESRSRLQKFKNHLTIQCPDGQERLFNLHVRMTPGHWRLYFCADAGLEKIIIGYIGSKLV